MQVMTGRQEEFGARSWTGMLVALLLTIAVGGSLLHPGAATQPHPPAAQVRR